MSESPSFKDTVQPGYDAIAGIQSDTSLTDDEQHRLMELDPTIEESRRRVADLFNAEAEECRRVAEARRDQQGPK